jgi:DNA topoisomerase IA
MNYLLRVNGQIIQFNGYLEIWPEKTKEETLPNVEKNEELEFDPEL